jgi:hypothetical protein
LQHTTHVLHHSKYRVCILILSQFNPEAHWVLPCAFAHATVTVAAVRSAQMKPPLTLAP